MEARPAGQRARDSRRGQRRCAVTLTWALSLAGLCLRTAGCPVTEWQQEARNNWLCSAGCWHDEWCRHGCSHELAWDIPRGYYVARAWLTASAYGTAPVDAGYVDYEMAEAHHDLEGTETYGERRYGGERGGWLDETSNTIARRALEPELVRTYVDGAMVGTSCNATEPRPWSSADSLLADGFPAPRDYTTHPYETEARELERRAAPTEVRGARAQYNIWNTCVDRVDITAQLRSRVGPRVEVVLATAHAARGHGTRAAGSQNLGQQAYESGPYRFKARATLFLHLVPHNSLRPYLGPAYGDTHIKIARACLLAPGVEAHLPIRDTNESNVSCVFYNGQVSLGSSQEGMGAPDRGIVQPATLHADGSVSCVSPDMRSQIVPASGAFSEGWRELRVWRQFNGSGAAYPGTALSHALGYYVYSHAPQASALEAEAPSATVAEAALADADVARWQGSSTFTRRQGPALAYDYELPLRRNQDCADPNDVDC